MKTTLVALFSLVVVTTLKSQELSLQLLPGVIQYNGDLQGKFVSVKTLRYQTSFGANIRFNQLTFRINGMFAKIVGADSLGTNDVTVKRNLSFQSSLFEFSAGMQYEFFYDRKLTPFVYASAGFYKFDPYAYNGATKVYLHPLSTEGEGLPKSKVKIYKLTQAVIPLGAGVKYKLDDNWRLAAEVTTRILFSDYIDDISGNYPDSTALANAKGPLAIALSYRGTTSQNGFPSGVRRGNPGRNDTYYTASVGVIYTFAISGTKKRSNSATHSRRARTDCPKPAH